MGLLNTLLCTAARVTASAAKLRDVPTMLAKTDKKGLPRRATITRRRITVPPQLLQPRFDMGGPPPSLQPLLLRRAVPEQRAGAYVSTRAGPCCVCALHARCVDTKHVPMHAKLRPHV